MLCWEPARGPMGYPGGRRVGRTPPIDLRRNATSVDGVTRPEQANAWDRASKGAPMARSEGPMSKGPVASAAPNRSPASAVPTNPGTLDQGLAGRP